MKAGKALMWCVTLGLAALAAGGPAAAQPKPRVVDASMMKEIGIAWNLYLTNSGKAPARAADLDEFLESPGVKKALANGDIVLVANAKAEGSRMIAYEKEADNKGLRFVTFGDGSVKSVDEKDFKKLLEAK